MENTDKEIRLNKFGKEDYSRLISWVKSEEDMVKFSGPIFHYPLTENQLDEYLRHSNRLVYKVSLASSGGVIGHAELNNIDLQNKSARICRILIGQEADRNKGYGRLIIKALLHIGFDILRLHRIDLGVYDFNDQAINCYKKCGFTIEGLIKDNIRVGDSYWSTYNMSIISHQKDEA